MFKTGKLVGVALVVLAMSGCAAGVTESAPVEATSAPTETVQPSTEPSAMPTPEPPAEPVAAPITMEPVAPDERSEAQKAGFADENDWYLRSIKSAWGSDTLPTDEQLLGAAALACEAFEGGALPDDITVVQGDSEAAVNSNRNTVNYAIMAICPA